MGYYARLAAAGVEAVVIGGTTGPFGVVHTPQSWPTPGYDREGVTYPIFEALRGLAELQGGALRRVIISAPERVEGLAVERDGTIRLVLANLTAQPQAVQVGGRNEQLAPYGVAVRTIG